jgi:hypothetical protein
MSCVETRDLHATVGMKLFEAVPKPSKSDDYLLKVFIIIEHNLIKIDLFGSFAYIRLVPTSNPLWRLRTLFAAE